MFMRHYIRALNLKLNKLQKGQKMKKMAFFSLVLAFAAAGIANAVVADSAVHLDPNHFDLQIKQGCTETRTMTITNQGAVDLNFTIRTQIAGQSGQSAQAAGSIKNTSVAAAKTALPKHKNDASAPTGNHLINRVNCSCVSREKSTKNFTPEKKKTRFLKSLDAGTVKREFKIVPGLSVVKLPPGLSVENALKKLKNKGEILYAPSELRS